MSKIRNLFFRNLYNKIAHFFSSESAHFLMDKSRKKYSKDMIYNTYTESKKIDAIAMHKLNIPHRKIEEEPGMPAGTAWSFIDKYEKQQSITRNLVLVGRDRLKTTRQSRKKLKKLLSRALGSDQRS